MASRFDDDDEVMKFEVTEEDLAEEAGGFMGAGRGRGRQNKEQVFKYIPCIFFTPISPGTVRSLGREQ